MRITHIELSQIGFPDFEVHKVVRRKIGRQDHSRWIMSAPDGADATARLYYKIWNPTYIRRDNILAGLSSGFYNSGTVPALQSLIFSNGICRGYVMKECQPVKGLDSSFFREIVNKTIKAGLFSVQFGPSHTMSFKGRPTMIDLEGVYYIRDIDLVRLHHSAFACADYAEIVAELYRRTCGEGSRTVESIPMERHLSWRQQPLQKAITVGLKRLGRITARHAPMKEHIEL